MRRVVLSETEIECQAQVRAAGRSVSVNILAYRLGSTRFHCSRAQINKQVLRTPEDSLIIVGNTEHDFMTPSTFSKH
jgi:hypothetical protein